MNVWVLDSFYTKINKLYCSFSSSQFFGHKLATAAKSLDRGDLTTSQLTSIGFRGDKGHSGVPSFDSSRTVRVMLSLSGKISSTMANGNLPRFLSCISRITASPDLCWKFLPSITTWYLSTGRLDILRYLASWNQRHLSRGTRKCTDTGTTLCGQGWHKEKNTKSNGLSILHRRAIFLWARSSLEIAPQLFFALQSVGWSKLWTWHTCLDNEQPDLFEACSCKVLPSQPTAGISLKKYEEHLLLQSLWKTYSFYCLAFILARMKP